MNQVFARSEKLEDQINEIKLKIPEWKVLFTVDGVMSSNQMADFLGVSENEMNETLSKLKDMQLISSVEEETLVEAEKEDESDLEITPDDFEQKEASVEDEGSTEEKEVIEGRIELSGDEEIEEIKEESKEEEEDFFSMLEETEDSTEIEEKEDLPELEDKDEDILTESTEEKELEEKDEALSDQEFDQFIGGLLNEDEDKESSNLESDKSSLESETPLEVEEEEKETDLDFGDFFNEELTENEVELEEKPEVIEEEKEVEESIPEVPVAEEEPSKGKTILVVDDSVVIRKMVEIALENEQYNIVSVATGKDALKYLDENDPDLIILDIMLPDVNGLDVLKAVKASKQQIPVVMLSAKDTPRETSKAKELGANDFIPKPFKDEELVSKIKELVGN